MAVILLKRNEKGRVSLMYSSNMWGLTKGHALTWDIAADLRKALNKEVRENLGAKYVEEFNRPWAGDAKKAQKDPITVEEMLEKE